MGTKKFTRKCFVSSKKRIIPFKPEVNVEEVEVTESIYKKHFPQDDSVDFKNLKLSNIGSYSITNPEVAKKITDQISSDLKTTDKTITDAFGNMGGMTISLAKIFARVNSCEIVPAHCEILKNNVEEYGLSDKVNVVCGDYMDNMDTLKQDAIMFDPPWGGTDYKKKKELALSVNNVNIACIINKLLATTKFIYMLVPPNYKFDDLKMIDSKYKTEQISLEPERGHKSKKLIIFSNPSSAGRRLTRRRKKAV